MPLFNQKYRASNEEPDPAEYPTLNRPGASRSERPLLASDAAGFKALMLGAKDSQQAS
jgi:hypothetical protein